MTQGHPDEAGEQPMPADASGGEPARPAPPSPDAPAGPPPQDSPPDISGVDDVAENGTDDGVEAGVPPEPSDEPSVEAAPADTAATAELSAEEELDVVRREAADRLADLQRLQAEFVNYKRRVERDRELVKQNALYSVLTPMLDVLDSIDRAREHGELQGGFKGVADQLERVVTQLGLTRFGEPGDPFDPTIHEALSHLGTDPEVQVPTARHVAKSGYRFGDRVVRAAQVIVVDPEG